MGSLALKRFIERTQTHPQEFYATEHQWIHRNSRNSIWISNGYFFYEMPPVKFSLFDKMKIKPALDLWKDAKLMMDFKELP